MTEDNPVYPFSAIVGQNNMKDALLVNVVNPSIGGVLIKGEKGTAKSTAVRAIADLLPERKVIKDCIFHCEAGQTRYLCPSCRELIESGEAPEYEYIRMRVVELPISATEDRVAGTLDIEHAITKGKKKFEPGVLASANGNILYVDEVNLLDDHIVDLLLDAAAMGTNFVEREGISYSHPARFMLVGTMNPEEGDLRPQLLDRFGLSVNVEGEREIKTRTGIIRKRLEFEKDPHAFCELYEPMQQEIRDRIGNAKSILKEMEPDDLLLETSVKISLFLGVDGHRSDITFVKTSVAFAALDERDEIMREDLIKAARLALPHRMRKLPFEEAKLEFDKIDSVISESYAK
ncbi:ATP-binding protein [Methanolacinia paynteri]|uniref:ATP-binding protein n=1 Tax=Methanolacinia paynteri TaxID=230356 RepID=UPI00064F2C14|nr:AAA family ATPase [Methanolacinia paynteri]